MVYITRNLVSEAEFDTKTWQGLFKEKIALCMSCCSKLCHFFKLSLQNTHGQLMAS